MTMINITTIINKITAPIDRPITTERGKVKLLMLIESTSTLLREVSSSALLLVNGTVVVVVDVAASTVVAAEAIGNDGVTIFVVVKKASVVGVVSVLEVGKERRVAVVLL